MKADLVSGILPVRPDGRMLVLQRTTGTWEPPAGRLQPGESFEEGAAREMYEETGMLVAPQKILATWVGERPGGGALAAVTYVGRVNGGEVRLSGEHLDYRWVTLEEWLDLPSWWSRENILRVATELRSLPEEPDPEPSPPVESPDGGPVAAILGAGVVIVDYDWDEPRALLMRRLKPPLGLWENPGGTVETGEDFALCASRELLEETSLKAEIQTAWWTRVEPWKAPDDRELYAGVGFLARYSGGEVRLEETAHDSFIWATQDEWRELHTWYSSEESDTLWDEIERMRL
jgi:8-oxo-dGTP diphosphatase